MQAIDQTQAVRDMLRMFLEHRNFTWSPDGKLALYADNPSNWLTSRSFAWQDLCLELATAGVEIDITTDQLGPGGSKRVIRVEVR